METRLRRVLGPNFGVDGEAGSSAKLARRCAVGVHMPQRSVES